jgi:hypothetical protein
MKKTSIALILLLVYPVLSFSDAFIIKGMIINESDEDIYCTSRVKESIKEILEFNAITSKETEEAYGGNVPFYWHGNYIVDIKGVGVWEYTKKVIPNTIIWLEFYRVIRNELILFQAGSSMKADFSAPPGERITNYYMKLIQLLDCFFSEITVCDEDRNIFLTLEDLREYYDGLEDEEIRKNLRSVNLGEYVIVITQEMIDKGRRKHGRNLKQSQGVPFSSPGPHGVDRRKNRMLTWYHIRRSF